MRVRGSSLGLWVVLLAVAVLTPSVAWADFQPDDVGEVEAIQNRTYHLGQEFEFSISFFPYDAFYKAITPEAAYVFHFSDQLGWEAVRVGYALKFNTNLKDQLLSLGVAPTKFEEMQLFVSSDLIWSPIYGKAAAFNKFVLYGELYLALGGGAFNTDQNKWWPAPNVGLGARLFVSKALSLRFEVRENLLLETGGNFPSVIDVNLGLGINFGAAE